MKIPATISDPSEQILIATKNRIPRWPSSLNFQKQGQTKFHTLCAWDYKRICYHTQKKRVSCQASCFQNPPILLQLNDNWKKSSWAYISLYHHFHPHQTLHEQIFLQRKITSPLPCKDNPPILRAPKYTPPMMTYEYLTIYICPLQWYELYKNKQLCSYFMLSGPNPIQWSYQCGSKGLSNPALWNCPWVEEFSCPQCHRKKSSIFYIRNMFHTLYCTTST